MGTQENKAVVRRFGDMLTTGRITDPELVDELLAPNYVNLAMGDADLAAFKAMVPAMASVMKDVRIDDLELVAEGDAVFAGSTTASPSPTGARRQAEPWRTTASLTARSW